MYSGESDVIKEQLLDSIGNLILVLYMSYDY